MRYRLLAVAILSLSLIACSDSNNNSAPPPVGPEPEPSVTYSAEVRRTEYGIPHIKAEDWGSLGYGFGYAYAQDNFCVVMREIVFATGRSAELIGESEGSPENDFFMRFINGDRDKFREDNIDALPDDSQDLLNGYVAGLNRYLTETGIENLPEGDYGCRNAEWVFAPDATDLVLFLRRISLQGSSDNGVFRNAILATVGPTQPSITQTQVDEEKFEQARQRLQQAAQQMRQLDKGSNGLALGSAATQDGGGLLLGNPHQPWFGAGAWYEAHLTLPGIYDVAGASLHGYPFIAIGFNRDVAWTHTVSLANRFSLYELKLNPDNPLQYDYAGEWRDIASEDIDIQVKLADGTMETRSKTFYTSHYGPVVNMKSVTDLLDGWPMFNGSVLAFRDANLSTAPRGVQQWIEKGQATNIDEYIESLSIIGNPLFHDLAADRNGKAFYGEVSAVPFVTQAQLDSCINGVVGPLLAGATTNVIVSLDGSDPFCEWGDSPDAPAGSNLYPSKDLPQIVTTDYVSNSNDSYWLSDANNPLEGFPTIMGPVGHEGLQQFLRTRLGHLMVAQRKSASDGFSETPLFDRATLKAMMYSNRVYGAELVLDDVLEICATDAAAGVQQACEVLANWDRKVNLDSRGAQIFTEFWSNIRTELENPFQNIVQSEEFWAVDFDPQDPLNTPAGIDTVIDANHKRVILALGEATKSLNDANVSLGAPWGEVQVLQRNNETVPIHGGAGTMGVYGAISASLNDGGYINPRAGNSYIQIVSWDESECPIADVVLVPSQSTDPASPHFADQAKLYSNKQWLRFPFCEEDIVAQQIGETLVLEE
ncbi:MAG: acyl-homoserine-lactone acylase [Halioglobus sp.]|jgi:acyl-homoserine-lactone acylase